MPLYDFECVFCGFEYEAIAGIKELERTGGKVECPRCHLIAHRVIKKPVSKHKSWAMWKVPKIMGDKPDEGTEEMIKRHDADREDNGSWS